MEIEIDEVFGLPAHPLLVHAVVVLLPLAAVATLACAAFLRLRRHYAAIALALGLAATVAAFVAQGSGEELEDRVDETELVEAHTDQGETVLPWAAGVAVVAAAVVAAPGFVRRRAGTGRAVTSVLVVLALVAGVGAIWRVVEVGHSGAKATWNDVDETRDESAKP